MLRGGEKAEGNRAGVVVFSAGLYKTGLEARFFFALLSFRGARSFRAFMCGEAGRHYNESLSGSAGKGDGMRGIVKISLQNFNHNRETCYR